MTSCPAVVAIDAEGTQHTPPLLVQIAADTTTRVLLVEPGADLPADLLGPQGAPLQPELHPGPDLDRVALFAMTDI